MKLSIVILLFFISACESPPKDFTCNLEIMNRSIDERVIWHDSNIVSVYSHILVLKDYKPDCFLLYNFVHVADTYIDTVSEKPIDKITFCKSFNLDNADGADIDKNSIISIWYNEDSIFNAIPEIRSIAFWNNGQNYWLDNLPVHLRYYNKDSVR